jgi:3-keto-5-aminohexanoate cleavage enzyme
MAVAPNGGRKTKVDHPALPTSADELARTAAECLERGASMIHLHVRDRDGGPVLDAEAYRLVMARICQTVGDRIVLQITSEAIGRCYTPAHLQTIPGGRLAGFARAGAG